MYNITSKKNIKMKKLITIIAVLVVSFTNAQIVKYKASDFNLSADVTKYEEK